MKKEIQRKVQKIQKKANRKVSQEKNLNLKKKNDRNALTSPQTPNFSLGIIWVLKTIVFFIRACSIWPRIWLYWSLVTQRNPTNFSSSSEISITKLAKWTCCDLLASKGCIAHLIFLLFLGGAEQLQQVHPPSLAKPVISRGSPSLEKFCLCIHH